MKSGIDRSSSYLVVTVFVILYCSKNGEVLLPKKMADAVSDRITRTDLNIWTPVRCDAARVAFEAPQRAELQCSQVSGVRVRMHQISPPRGVIDDVRYGIEISMERAPVKPSTGEASASGSSDDIVTWMSEHHGTFAQRTDRDYTYYRYDTSCGVREYIRAAGRRWQRVSHASKLSASEDDAAVRRLMLSAKCE